MPILLLINHQHTPQVHHYPKLLLRTTNLQHMSQTVHRFQVGRIQAAPLTKLPILPPTNLRHTPPIVHRYPNLPLRTTNLHRTPHLVHHYPKLPLRTPVSVFQPNNLPRSIQSCPNSQVILNYPSCQRLSLSLPRKTCSWKN
uniref:Uncharacterized protein n=1 Tax=Cacopsylla melanoneura TaxID=428564 RepID=A0A8D8TMU3_9HEMI